MRWLWVPIMMVATLAVVEPGCNQSRVVNCKAGQMA
jgi:hypothetical protein